MILPLTRPDQHNWILARAQFLVVSFPKEVTSAIVLSEQPFGSCFLGQQNVCVPLPEQQSSSLGIATELRCQPFRCFIAQKVRPQFALHTQAYISHYLLFHFLTEQTEKIMFCRKHLLAVKWTVTPMCWAITNMISSLQPQGLQEKEVGCQTQDLTTNLQ